MLVLPQIRKALTQLQTSGIVEALPNKRFFITELDKSEVINLYELVTSLEALAVKTTLFSQKKVLKIRKI